MVWMRRRFVVPVLAVILFMTGCKDSTRKDPKAEIVGETVGHIGKLGPKVAGLSRLSEFTPASEVVRTLRVCTGDLTQWQRDYRTLRAKMIARNVSRAQHQEVNRQHKSALEDLTLKVEQAERRLSRRSDTHVFQVDLQRMRRTVRDL
jgi:hypothetical protein